MLCNAVRNVVPGEGERIRLDVRCVTLNLYLYAGCDPVNSLDPTGRMSTCDKILLAFGAATAVNAAIWFVGTLFGFPILAAIKGFEEVEGAICAAFGTAAVIACLRRA